MEISCQKHSVFLACDSSQWLCLSFDPVGIQWMRLPGVLSGIFWLDFGRPLAVGTELLLLGRRVTWLDKIHKFSILTNSWSLGRQMNEPRRSSFGAASLGEIAIVAGGCDQDGKILSSAEVYNSNTGTWESLPRMNRPRMRCSGVFMDGNFYVVGGNGGVGNLNVLTCGEMYDFKTRRWHVIPNMFPAQHSWNSALPLLAVVKNELYAAFYWENEVRKYDKGRNLWSTVGNMPEGADFRNGWGMALRAYGDKLILIVGDGEGIEVYDWVPDERPLQWNFVTFNDEPSLAKFADYCTVMSY